MDLHNSVITMGQTHPVFERFVVAVRSAWNEIFGTRNDVTQTDHVNRNDVYAFGIPIGCLRRWFIAHPFLSPGYRVSFSDILAWTMILIIYFNYQSRVSLLVTKSSVCSFWTPCTKKCNIAINTRRWKFPWKMGYNFLLFLFASIGRFESVPHTSPSHSNKYLKRHLLSALYTSSTETCSGIQIFKKNKHRKSIEIINNALTLCTHRFPAIKLKLVFPVRNKESYND